MTSVPDITHREPIPELPPANVRKKLRLRFGVTQQELADECGVSRKTVINWEGGSEPIGIARVKYANVLNAWQTQTER